MTDCAVTTGTQPDVMSSFRCELKDVMTALLETSVMQILQLVQKDFWDKLKQNEQEIHGLHMKLQRLIGHSQAEGDKIMEAEEETFQDQTRTVEEPHNRETETNLVTDEPGLRQKLAGNEGNTENDLEIIQLHKVGNAESVAEAAGAGIIRETGSESFQNDMGAVINFIDGREQAGNENQREKQGQKSGQSAKRVRVKSEKEDGDGLMHEKLSSVEEVVVLKLEDSQVEGSELREDPEVG